MDGVRATEAASAAVAVNPDGRVKLADIEAVIAGEFYFSAADAVRGTGVGTGSVQAGFNMTATDIEVPKVMMALVPLTICLLVTRNGFTVIGHAAPADTANFNPALGRKLAREQAIRQLWPLMAFAMKDRLHSENVIKEVFRDKLASSGVRDTSGGYGS